MKKKNCGSPSAASPITPALPPLAAGHIFLIFQYLNRRFTSLMITYPN